MHALLITFVEKVVWMIFWTQFLPHFHYAEDLKPNFDKTPNRTTTFSSQTEEKISSLDGDYTTVHMYRTHKTKSLRTEFPNPKLL